jgi:hypothetical protein
MADSAFENFAYTSGGTQKFQDIEGRLDAIGVSLASSFLSNNTSSTADNVVTLGVISPLPAPGSVGTGSIAFSGSNTSLKMYVYTGYGTVPGATGWSSASLAG